MICQASEYRGQSQINASGGGDRDGTVFQFVVSGSKSDSAPAGYFCGNAGYRQRADVFFRSRQALRGLLPGRVHRGAQSGLAAQRRSFENVRRGHRVCDRGGDIFVAGGRVAELAAAISGAVDEVVKL